MKYFPLLLCLPVYLSVSLFTRFAVIESTNKSRRLNDAKGLNF